MTDKRYKWLERSLEIFIATVILTGAAILMVGVYALADLVF